LGLGLTGIRVDQLQQKDPVLRRGMSGYLLPFEIVSVHLLVVLVGAAFLARAKKRAGKRTPQGPET
jgi:NADH-quinone oxidoreductase subunit J